MGDDEASEQPGWLLSGLLPVLLTVLLVVLLVVGFSLYRDRAAFDEGGLRAADVRGNEVVGDSPAGDAVRVARQASRRLFTLDHRRVDEDLAALQELATDEFREEHARDSAELRRRVERRRLVISAQVPVDAIATEYVTAGSAQVLVAVDVRTAGPTGLVDEQDYLTRVDLEKVDDRWRVAGIEQIR